MITEEEKEFCLNVSQIALGPHEARFNTVELVNDIIDRGIDGDFVEAGVFAGAHPIIMSAISVKRNAKKKTHLFDSFQGIPKVLDYEHEHDQKVYGLRKEGEPITSSGISNVDLAGVKNYVGQFGGYLPDMVFHEGWFQDTMPNSEIEKISLLRLDGDLLESLNVTLMYLYPKIVKGGYFVADDYMNPTCRKRIDEFMAEQGIVDAKIIGPEQSIIYWKV